MFYLIAYQHYDYEDSKFIFEKFKTLKQAKRRIPYYTEPKDDIWLLTMDDEPIFKEEDFIIIQGKELT